MTSLRRYLIPISVAALTFGVAVPIAAPAIAAPAAVRPTVTAVSPPAGRTTGGDTVTVAGTDLDVASAVYFASARASHLVHVSSTRLTVQVPPNSVRTVHVRVMGPGGRSPEVSGDRYTYVGHAPEQQWTKAATIDAENFLNDVSCASARSCTAVDAEGNALTYDGTKWSSPRRIDRTRDVIKVDCPGIHFCLAIDGRNGSGDTHAALRKVADTWQPERTPLTTDDVGGLSCSSSHLCVLTTESGRAYVYRDGTWDAGTTIDPRPIDAVSCPDDTFCLAIDQYGRELVFNGTSWTNATPTGNRDAYSERYVTGVSCATRYYCVTGNNEVFTRRAGVWGNAGFRADGSSSGFSCASVLFCSVIGYVEDETSPTLFFSGAAAAHTHRPFLGGVSDYAVIDCPAPGHCVEVSAEKAAETIS